MEKAGRLTATGLTNWSCANIGRILNNPFYCGTVVYRKQFVPDYLEQKKINNFDYVDKVVVEGTHETIITKEEFEQVQKILRSKSSSVNNKGARGRHVSNDVWCRKLKCSCGASFNRRVWRRINGVPQYAYQCYHQIQTGTVRTRLNKGLSIEGICDVPMVPGWKLGAMADIVFQKFWNDREGVLRVANEMLDKHYKDDREQDFSDEITDIQNKLGVLERKFDNLVDMLMSYHIEEDLSDEELDNKLKVLKYGLEQDFNFSTHSIPEEVIDAFVDQIIVYKD